MDSATSKAQDLTAHSATEQDATEQDATEQDATEQDATEKPHAVSVYMNQRTGRYVQGPKTYDNWDEANAYLYRARRGADIGYNKVKFTVTMSDGSVYSGRYDVSLNEWWKYDLAAHIQEHLEAVTADDRAPHQELAAQWLHRFSFEMKPVEDDAPEQVPEQTTGQAPK